SFNNNLNNINKDYYTINNYEFSKLNKDKGDNRQLHKEDMKKIKELSKLYAKKKNISLDEATNVIAKGYYALVDNDANEFYIKNLDEDKAVEVLKSQDFIKNNLDYSKTAFIDNNELTGVGFATKEQYYNRYSNLKDYAENKDFYNKYLGIDDITNNTKISSLNLAQGAYKPYKDLTHQAITNPLNTAKDMLIAMLNPINSGYEYGNNLRQTYEKANLDKFLNDTANTNRHYGELTGSLAPVVIPSMMVGTTKGISKASSIVKISATNKLISQLPNNTLFNSNTNIIKILDKNYIVVEINNMTKNPIIREVKEINKKDILVGNYYITSSKGLQPIGKNALTNSGVRVLTNKNKQISANSNMFIDGYYKYSNKFLVNPAKYNEGIPQFIDGYLPGAPDLTKAGMGGWLMYQTLHPDELKEQISDSYNEILKTINNIKY
ncbi:hypothetical protein, partial [Campylobacter ureolyticus]|uniref:hypothetical protein n=1 Tax=Campylobacter ureolyticus TaxID=827 RepID=UPI002910A89A